MSSQTHRPLKALKLVRDLWLMAGITCVLILSLEAVARGYYFFRNQVLHQPPATQDKRVESEAYRDAPWVHDYFREFHESYKTRWQPYVYWRRTPYSGSYVNVGPDGRRRTYNPSSFTNASTEVTMLGGSTLWGTGARDDYTVPSLLSKQLEKEGSGAFHVTNLGESGYVSTQELIQLALELRQGNVPDVAIFYHGANDVFSAFQNNETGIPQNENHRRREFNSLNRTEESSFVEYLKRHSSLATGMSNLADRLMPAREGAERETATVAAGDLAEEAVSAYMANLRLARAWAGEYRFELLFFWQPTLFSKNNLSDEEALLKASYDVGMRDFFKLVDSAIAELNEAPEDFHDLQEAFGDRSETFFIDFCHLGEEGNQVVADLIFQVLVNGDL